MPCPTSGVNSDISVSFAFRFTKGSGAPKEGGHTQRNRKREYTSGFQDIGDNFMILTHKCENIANLIKFGNKPVESV